MANITGILAAGAGWGRVAKVNAPPTRREDSAEMHRVCAEHFPGGKYQGRTIAVAPSPPRPDFPLGIDWVAVLA